MHPTTSSSNRFSLLTIVLTAAFGATLLAGNDQAPATTPVAAAGLPDEVTSERRGKVVEAPDNIRRFRPEEPKPVDGAPAAAPLSPEAIVWNQHVQTLANPFFEGRGPGTKGIEYAADYIEYYFKEAGLTPPFPEPEQDPENPDPDPVTYRQPFKIAGQKVQVLDESVLVNGQPIDKGHDYVVLGNSGNGEVEAPVTFVGYSIEQGQDGYSSYPTDADLKGRIAMMLRYEPLDDKGRSRWSESRYSRNAAIVPKMNNAADRGAVGIILVNPPGLPQMTRRLEATEASQFGGDFKIPIIQVSREVAERILSAGEPQQRDLMTLRKLADDGELKTVPLKDDVRVRLAAKLERSKIETENIGGVIKGNGPLAKQWIIIGAHYDHLGYGNFGSAEGITAAGKIHPGADDNASGIAGLLLLVDKINEALREGKGYANRRSILFLAFSAEESGLGGSRYFVQHPTMAAENVNLMINMDMIGRLRDKQVLVTGTGTAEGFSDMLQPFFEDSGLTVNVSPGGNGPSDHTSFFNAGIPVLMFNTGLHEEYHTPADVASTVNAAGAVQVLDLVKDLAIKFATEYDPLKFVRNTQGGGGSRVGARVRLGIMPGEYGENEKPGVLVANVSEGTSAAEAGIRAGDILIAWNGEPMEGPRNLGTFLRAHKPGDVVTLTLLRSGETMTVPVTLKASEQK